MSTELSESEAEELLELAMVLGYASVAWWFLAGAASLYWVTGGTVGVGTLWVGSDALLEAREPWLVTALWVIGVFELVLATFSVSVARGWGRPGILAVVNADAFLVELTLVPYVAVDTLVSALVTIDVFHPVVLEQTALVWRLLFWNPWWIVGGLLYCVGAWLNQYASAQISAEPDSHV